MSETRIWYRILRDEAERSAVLHWWQRLTGTNEHHPPWSPSLRAVLRRAASPDDALLTEAFRHLWFALPEGRRKPWDMPAWGCVAAVLSEIRQHDDQREFAAAMGAEPEKGPGKPRVSELRFAQLRRSADLTEFQRRMRRAVHLLGDQAHVLSVADGILHWHREKGGYFDHRPDRRLAVRWATAYFTELARHQKAESAS